MRLFHSLIPLRIACRLAHINVNKSWDLKKAAYFCIPCQLYYSQHTHRTWVSKKEMFSWFFSLFFNIKIEDCMQKLRELRRGVAPQKVLLVYVSFLVLLLQVCSIYIILSLSHSFFLQQIPYRKWINCKFLFYALQLIISEMLETYAKEMLNLSIKFMFKERKLYIVPSVCWVHAITPMLI
jgi:hypothetical protein